MFNHIANLCEKKGYRVLIICDRRELIEQSWQKIWDGHGIHAGIILSGVSISYQLPVQIASIQTLNKRNFPPNIDLVIIDECRGSVAPSYAPVFAFYNGAHFLGVDATPIRTNGQGFDHLYDAMVLGPSIKEMEAMGALTPAKFFVNPINQSLLDNIGKVAGDYNEGQLAELMSRKDIVADAIASKLKYAKGLKTIAFAVDIKHSKAVMQQYKDAGISCVHVDGGTDEDERKQIFRNFANDRFEVLINVGIATYGYDEPSIFAVQDLAPTLSLSRWLQKLGRGARKFPGKEYYTLLDHANGIHTHGLPNADRKWTLKSTKSQKPKAKKFLVKQEGKQMAIMSEREAPAQHEGMELVELTPETLAFYKNAKKFDTIHRRQQSAGFKPLWAYFQYASKYPDDMGLQELQYIGTKLGFKPGWGYYKHKELQEKAKTAAMAVTQKSIKFLNHSRHVNSGQPHHTTPHHTTPHHTTPHHQP